MLFPELSVTGYSCEDLFFTRPLLDATRAALATLVRATSGTQAVLVVGAPWLLADGRLLNCAFVAARGRLVGAVPKSAHPNYAEFYEKRWFVSGADIAVTDRRRGIRCRFRSQRTSCSKSGQTRFAIEICEDLWAPDPIGNRHALAGADLILNPSASTDLVGKADYRRDLVRMTSGAAHLRLSVRLVRPHRVDERRRVRRPSDRGRERPAARRIGAIRARRQRASSSTSTAKSCATTAPSTTRLQRLRGRPTYSSVDTGVTPAPISCADAKLPAASVRARRRTRVRRARSGNSVDSGDGSRAPPDRRPHRNAGHRIVGRPRFDVRVPRLSRRAR